jgi:hypothetical protein
MYATLLVFERVPASEITVPFATLLCHDDVVTDGMAAFSGISSYLEKWFVYMVVVAFLQCLA